MSKSNLSSFSLMNRAFMSHLRILCLTQGHKDFSLMFSSKSFIASCFIFKSIIHFEVIFTERIRLCFPSRTVMLKITQARLQQYVNRELPDVQAGFRKGRGTRDQTANLLWIIEIAREFQKDIYFCFIDYAKSLWLCELQQTMENS